MSHRLDTRLAARDPRLNVADVYLFDAAPDRTAMVMTCSAETGLPTPEAFHPAGLYEFRFDTTGNGFDDTVFQVRFTEDPRQEFTVHYVTGTDHDVHAAGRVCGKLVFSAELNSPRRIGAIDGFAGLVGDIGADYASVLSAVLHPFYGDRRIYEAAYAKKRNHLPRRDVMAIVLEVPNVLIGNGQVAMWSSISLCGRTVKAQVSRSGIPFFSQLFLSPWRQHLVDRYNEVSPLRDNTLFAGPVRRFVAEFSAYAGLGRISEPYAIGVAARLIPTVLSYTIGSAATFTTEIFNGRPLGVDAFEVMISLAAGRTLGDGAARDVSRLLDVFPYYGPPCAAMPEMKEMERYADWGRIARQPGRIQSRR